MSMGRIIQASDGSYVCGVQGCGKAYRDKFQAYGHLAQHNPTVQMQFQVLVFRGMLVGLLIYLQWGLLMLGLSQRGTTTF